MATHSRLAHRWVDKRVSRRCSDLRRPPYGELRRCLTYLRGPHSLKGPEVHAATAAKAEHVRCATPGGQQPHRNYETVGRAGPGSDPPCEGDYR